MHLVPSVGASLLLGCGDDSSGDEGGGSSSGGSTSAGPGTTSGGGGSSSDGGDSTDGGSSSGADSSSDGGSDESTGTSGGQEIDCNAQWWMCGNYAPVDGDFEATGDELTVEGTIPPELEGVYVRNGPNPGEHPSGHWFLGDGMVHGVWLGRGGASAYRARYVQTPILGAPPERVGPPNGSNHQANTSVVWHGGRLLTLSEIGLPYEVSPTDLATVGTHDFGGALEGPMTAHPKIDPATGELVFFGYHLLESTVHLHFIDPAGMQTRTEIVPVPAPSMMHDFQLTATHVVLMDFPVIFDIDLAIKGEALPFSWQPKNGARIGVMPRNGTADDIQWYETDLGYVFHTYNAWNDPMNPDVIYLDAVYYPEMWAMGANDFENDGVSVRYTIDTSAGTVTRETFEERQLEFPQIDPRRRGLEHRYGYGVGVSKRPPDGAVGPADTIVKLDHQGSMSEYTLDGMQLDELTFVPASADSGEDEGWLMSYAYVPGSDVSRLVIFDATNISAGPVGTVGLPQRVPFGFHGTWVPS